VSVQQGFLGEMNHLCPSCRTDVLTVPTSSIGSDLPTRVTAYLRTHSSVNAIAYPVIDEIIGMPEALSSNGLDSQIKVTATINTSSLAASQLNSGQLTALISTAYQTTMGFMLDALIRSFNGKPQLNWPGMTWIVTKANLPQDTNTAINEFPNGVQVFQSFWGIQG
jgi:ribose transport system substrate-binding protein